MSQLYHCYSFPDTITLCETLPPPISKDCSSSSSWRITQYTAVRLLISFHAVHSQKILTGCWGNVLRDIHTILYYCKLWKTHSQLHSRIQRTFDAHLFLLNGYRILKKISDGQNTEQQQFGFAQRSTTAILSFFWKDWGTQTIQCSEVVQKHFQSMSVLAITIYNPFFPHMHQFTFWYRRFPFLINLALLKV